MAKRAEATDRTRGRIEAALMELLTARPYNTITIADIAAEADVSVRTVQRHYASKSDLMGAIALSNQAEVGAAMSTYPSTSTPEEAISELVRKLFALFERRNLQYWAAYTALQDTEEANAIRDEMMAARARLVAEIMSKWPGVWRIEEEAAGRAANALLNYGSWKAMTWFADITSQEAARITTDALCRYLLRPSQT